MNPAAEPVDRYDFYRYHPGFWKPITSLAWGLRVSYHADHETAAGGEDGALLAPGVRHRQSKIDNWHELINQADMLREKGMGNYRDLLVAMAKNPAMIGYDNCDNTAMRSTVKAGAGVARTVQPGRGYGWASQLHGDRRPGGSRAFTGWTIAERRGRLITVGPGIRIPRGRSR